MRQDLLKRLSLLAFENFHLPTVKKAKHFCFVLKKGKLYTFGWNQRVQWPPNLTIHAEIHALNRVKADRRNHRLDNIEIAHGLTFVCVRIDNTGQLGQSEPCQKCKESLWDHGVSKLWYSTGSFMDFKRCKLD